MFCLLLLVEVHLEYNLLGNSGGKSIPALQNTFSITEEGGVDLSVVVIVSALDGIRDDFVGKASLFVD